MGRPRGGRNQTTYEIADAIWATCAEHGRIGLTKAEVCREVDISPAQFSNAMILIKEMFQEEKEQPIVYMPKTRRYVFNASETDAREYGKWMLGRWQTQVRRSKHYVHALELKFGDSVQIRRLGRRTDDILDDLSEMLDSLER